MYAIAVILIAAASYEAAVVYAKRIKIDWGWGDGQDSCHA